MDISPNTIKQSVSTFLQRYHLIVFIVIVVGLLIFVMFQINDVIKSSSSSTVTAPTTQSFDKTTMDKIKKLHASGQSSTPLKLSGRSSPFVE